jgi:hypothetical protein
MNNSEQKPQSCQTDVSGSFFEILDTIHDNLIDKGYDCFNDDGTSKEVDDYKLTFKIVSDELKKHCIKSELKKILQNKLIINGFEISQVKNSDGNNLSPNFLQWKSKDLFSDLTFFGQNKKECVSWSENYR